MQTDAQPRQEPLSQEEMAPHLKILLRKIAARKWVLISILLTCVASATVYVFLQTPVYVASSRLEIQPVIADSDQVKAAYDPTLSGEGGVAVHRAFLETQYELILADSVIEKTARHFNLNSSIREGFEVLPVQYTWLADITFEWTDPVQTAEIVNYLIGVYLEEYYCRTRSVNSEMLEAKVKLASSFKADVAVRYEAWQTYISDHNLIHIENASEKLSQSYNRLKATFNEAVLTHSEAKRRHDGIVAALENGNLDSIPEIVDDAAINALKVELHAARIELRRLQQDFGKIHPAVESAENDIAMIERMIALEKEAFVAVEEQRFERARKAEEFHRKLLTEEEQGLEQFNQALGEYNSLENEYKQAQRNLDDVNEVIRELQMVLNTEADAARNINIISAAKVPTVPVKPRRTEAIVFAALAGLIIGVGLCLLADYLDTTIKTKEDVEKILGMPTLGFVPPIDSARAKGSQDGELHPELQSLEKPRSLLAESFRSIRTSLMFSKAGRGLKNILVTSAVPLEGKTTVSVNIAITLALAGKKVLLIDADMRRPCVGRIFDISSRPGLSNILAGEGERSLDKAIRRVDVENLSILPSGPQPPNPAELLGSDGMKRFTAELTGMFDHVIFDTPPLINATDGTIVTQHADGIVLVVRSFRTDVDFVVRARDMLNNAQANVLGVVLNNADVSRDGYYGYGGKYYHTYYSWNYYSSDKTKTVRKRQRRGSGRKPEQRASTTEAPTDKGSEA